MSETLEVIGCLAARGARSRCRFSSPSPRVRAAGLVLAGALALALIAGQGWDDIRNLREHHLEFAGVIVAGIVVLAVGAAAMLRWPILLPLLVIATLPFRVRLHVAGGEAVNLLVPLYVVIGSGVLATVVATLRGQTRLRRLPKPLVLALVVVDLPVRAADHLLTGRRLRRPQRRLLPGSVRDPLLPAGRGDLGSPAAPARPLRAAWPRG